MKYEIREIYMDMLVGNLVLANCIAKKYCNQTGVLTSPQFGEVQGGKPTHANKGMVYAHAKQRSRTTVTPVLFHVEEGEGDHHQFEKNVKVVINAVGFAKIMC